MFDPRHNDELPAIPGKRYFTIGEVSELCAVKPHVLRYWEQEFPQLSPVKRRGNRRLLPQIALGTHLVVVRSRRRSVGDAVLHLHAESAFCGVEAHLRREMRGKRRPRGTY